MSILESGLQQLRRAAIETSEVLNVVHVGDIDTFTDQLAQSPSTLIQARVIRQAWRVDEFDPGKGYDIEYLTQYVGKGGNGQDLVVFAEEYPEDTWVSESDAEGLERMRIQALATAGHRLLRIKGRAPSLPWQLLYGEHVLSEREIEQLDDDRKKHNIFPFSIPDRKPPHA